MDKKRKAEEKRNRRKERKAAESALTQDVPDDETEDVAQAATDHSPVDDD